MTTIIMTILLISGNRMFNPINDINWDCVNFRWWVSVGDWHWDLSNLELSVRVGKSKFWSPAAEVDAAITESFSDWEYGSDARYFVSFMGSSIPWDNPLPGLGGHGHKTTKTQFGLGGTDIPVDAAHSHLLNLQPDVFIRGYEAIFDSLTTMAICYAWCYLLGSLGPIAYLLDYVTGWAVRTRCKTGPNWSIAQYFPTYDSSNPSSFLYISEWYDPIWDPSQEVTLSDLGIIDFGPLQVLQFPIHTDWLNAIEGLPIYYGTYLAFLGLSQMIPLIPPGFNLPSVRCVEVTSHWALEGIDSVLHTVNVDIFAPVGWLNPPNMGSIFDIAKKYAPTGCWGPLFPRNSQALHLDEHSTRARIAIQGVTRFFDNAYLGDTTNSSIIPGFNFSFLSFRGWERFTTNRRPGGKLRYRLQEWNPKKTRCFEIGQQETFWAEPVTQLEFPTTAGFVLWLFVQCEHRLVFYIDFDTQDPISPNCGCL